MTPTHPLLTRLAQLANTLTHPVGSIGGLLALGQHQTDVAGTHLRNTLPFSSSSQWLYSLLRLARR